MKQLLFNFLKPSSLLALSLLLGCSLGTLPRSLPPKNLQAQNQLMNTGLYQHAPLHKVQALGASLKREVETPENTAAWPLAEHSARYPLSVRYQKMTDKTKAREVLAVLEQSWRIEIEQLGFRPPFAYDPFAKPGEARRLNAFLQRGADTAVEGRSPVKADGVWWDAYDAWISIDAWGPYAGNILPSTVAHEFNHALHAACDWYESPGFFETSATYIQEKVTPDDNDYLEQIEDFQQNPQWPVHYDDAYKSLYMYGASLYLFFLEQRYFPQKPDFLARIWDGSRNQPRAFDPVTDLPSPQSNEPDWADALENLLPRGVSYADTVVEFARWRWYTGRRSDSRHFHEAHLLKPKGEVRVAAKVTGTSAYRSSGLLVGGSEYLSFKRPASGLLKLNLSIPPLSAKQALRWVVQAVPGLTPNSDGELLTPVNGTLSLNFGSLPERTLIVTALPADGVLDPDSPAGMPVGFSLNALP